MHESRVALLALFGLCAGACATNPDVVATGQTLQEAGGDGSFYTDKHRCYPGLYTGTFNHSTSADARPTYPVSGAIQFRLLETGSGEFSIVESGAKLSAKPDQGNRISADIDPNVDGGRGGCYEGVFRVDLANGEYYPDDASAFIKFTGIVEGTYGGMVEGTNRTRREFTGQWRAFLDKTTILISQGEWQALWHAN